MGRELLVAKPLITNISNKATGTFNKSDPCKTYHSEGFRWNRVECGRMEPVSDTGETGFILQCEQGLRKSTS